MLDHRLSVPAAMQMRQVGHMGVLQGISLRVIHVRRVIPKGQKGDAERNKVVYSTEYGVARP